MRNQFLLKRAIVATMAVGSSTAAHGAILGTVTMPGVSCDYSTSSGPYYCAFTQMWPKYMGPSVDSIYVDALNSSGTLEAAACEQSYSTGTIVCASWTTTTASGNVDLGIPGFSHLSAALSPYDYYYVQIASTGTVQLYGVGFN